MKSIVFLICRFLTAQSEKFPSLCRQRAKIFHLFHWITVFDLDAIPVRIILPVVVEFFKKVPQSLVRRNHIRRFLFREIWGPDVREDENTTEGKPPSVPRVDANPKYFLRSDENHKN